MSRDIYFWCQNSLSIIGLVRISPIFCVAVDLITVVGATDGKV